MQFLHQPENPKILANPEAAQTLWTPNREMRPPVNILSSAERTGAKICKVPPLWCGSCRGVRFADILYIGSGNIFFFSGGRANARNVCDFFAPFRARRKKEPTMAGGERGGIMGVGLMKNFTDADTFLDWMRCGRGRQTSHGPSTCLSGFFSWQVLGPPPIH